MESGQLRFCTACGTPIKPGAAFCAACGAKLEIVADIAVPSPTPTPAPPASPAVTSTEMPTPTPVVSMADPNVERIVSAAAGLSMKAGLLKRVTYTLVMTNYRILFAQTTSAMLKQNVMEARDSAKAEGGGFFKQWGAQISAGFNYADRYLEMTPEQVLAETPGNWALEIARIQKVKYKVGMVGDAETTSTPDKITIKTANQKYVLELSGGSTNATRQAFIDAGLI
ncbi:MAG: zinc-ribbon domain-containing protein [Coriobacteriia bacterium]|nr:zinc-ribbon domain-containing protein [Coriobacteriia bacterium]